MYVVIFPICATCPGCLNHPCTSLGTQKLCVPTTDIALATWQVNTDLFLYFNSHLRISMWLLPVVNVDHVLGFLYHVALGVITQCGNPKKRDPHQQTILK